MSAGTLKTSLIEQELVATRSDADKRRDLVSRYKAMGCYSNREIARILGVTEGQIRKDWQHIQADYVAERLPTLSARIEQSVRTRQFVMQEAYSVILDPRLDKKSQSRIGAMQIILNAQDSIDKLQGTTNPESVNAAAVAEFMNHVVAVIGRHGTAMYEEVLLDLSQSVGGTTIGVLLGAPDSSAPIEAIDDEVPYVTADDDTLDAETDVSSSDDE